MATKTKTSGKDARTVKAVNAAAKEQGEALLADSVLELEDPTIYLTAFTGRITLDPPDELRYPNGVAYNKKGRVFDFDVNHPRVAISDEDAADIEKALAGEYDNGYTPASELAENFKSNQVKVIRPGQAACPIPNWDVLKADVVVSTAKAAGYLKDETGVKAAARYEAANLKRVRVLNDLQRLFDDITGNHDEKAAFDGEAMELG